MRKQMSLFLMAVICATLVVVAHAQMTSSPQKPGGISGHVYRADTGAPLTHAVIAFFPTQSGDFRADLVAYADENGAYSLDGISPGAYVVEARQGGFSKGAYGEHGQDGTPQEVEVKPGQKLQNIDLRLLPGGIISGTVFDERHRPVAGVPVVALHPIFMQGGWAAVSDDRQAKADANGRFRIAGLETGAYYVKAAGHFGVVSANAGDTGKPTFLATYYPAGTTMSEADRVAVAAAQERTGIDIVLSTAMQSFTVRGTISNFEKKADDDNPAVNLSAAPQAGEFSIPDESWTAPLRPNGSFTISGIPPGDYYLSPYTYGSLADWSVGAPVFVKDGDVSVNIPMQWPGEVKGKVVLDPGAGAIMFKSLYVHLWATGDASSLLVGGYSRINEDGGFDMQSIAPGRYNIALGAPDTSPNYLKQVQCLGADYTTRPLTVTSGTTVGNCTLTIANDSGIIDGRVSSDDKPTRGIEVVAISSSRALRRSPSFTRMALRPTDGDGRFVLVGMIPGDYLLFAVPKDPEQKYFALDFADRNATCGEQVTINPHETKSINLEACLSPK